MKRSYMRRKSLKPKRKAHPMGSLGVSQVDKGPWESEEFRKRVTACGCMVLWLSLYPSPCHGQIDPHHCRKLAIGGKLPRDDRLCVPLCRKHHNEAHEGPGIEIGFQERYGLNFVRWISDFSQRGHNYLATLTLRT